MALSADRNTPRSLGEIRNGAMAASVKIFGGGIVMRNAAGYLTKGATATGSVGVGRAEEQVDNSAGSAGDASINYRPGVFPFNNSESADEITIAEIGDVCFIVDDETVAKTDGTNTRSIAGFVENVDAAGVWVRFDEVLARIYAEGIANPA